MEKETEEKVEEQAAPEVKKKSLNAKVFLIGLPLFIVQLVIVYFVTANILLSKMEHTAGTSSEENTEAVEEESIDSAENEEEPLEVGKFIFPLEDIIVNPAGTNGQRLMLVSIGLDVANEEEMKILEEKEVLLKDMIITLFSSKSLTELSNTSSKEELKVEITEKVSELLPKIKINSVYFSKYILQ